MIKTTKWEPKKWKDPLYWFESGIEFEKECQRTLKRLFEEKQPKMIGYIMTIDVIIFRLKKLWYEEIKAGRKTSEWREASDYWLKRLCTLPPKKIVELVNEKSTSLNIVPLPTYSKSKAWFTIGCPKNNLPRLEADIVGILLHRDTQQLEIRIQNVKETFG